jgi:aminopeptidase N
MKNKLYPNVILLLLAKVVLAQTIDTKHLVLNLKFDWQKRTMHGIADITFTTVNATDRINLDAGNLGISSVSLNNSKLKYTYDGGDSPKNLIVYLDKAYQSNETISLKIIYQTNHENKADPNAIWGSFGKGLRLQEPTSTTPNKRKQIWSSGEPSYNKYWFPCNEDIADIHTTEIIATVEKPLLVISNGKLIETKENSDHTRSYHYKTENAFPNYLVTIIVGEYADILQNKNGYSVHNFGYPQEIEAVKATTELLPDMMQFIEERTAYKYPFSSYSQVVVQDYPFPGLVGQNSVSILSDNYIDDYGVHKDFNYLWDGVAVQALANQWFGNLIMPKSWSDCWLNNAFAQYFADLYTEKINTSAEYLLYGFPFEKSNVLGDWNAGNRHPIVTTSTKDLVSFTSDSYSKYRGALVLRMLQKQIGDSSWWKAVQFYVKTNANKQVTTKDFQKAIEHISGQSYQWFFDQWVYKIGVANVAVNKTYDPDKKQLTIVVEQKLNKDTTNEYEQVGFFKGKVDIEIDAKLFPIEIQAQEKNVFTFSLPKAPEFVNFNFEDRWFCEMDYKQSKDEYLNQLAQSKDVLAKQRALDKLVEVAKDSTTLTELKNRISAAFKAEIKSNLYWRYRQYALGSLRKIIPLPYDQETINFLLALIKNEHSWVKTAAIFTLGNSLDEKYFDIYKEALKDESDRVINAAAIAIGKTKSSEAFDALMELESKTSWKNQNRISALNGLELLNDPRALDYVLTCLADNQSPRWYLATPVWDYPFAAANTLVALGKADLGYPILFERFKKSLQENDLNDIFQNVQLIDILKDERAKEMYSLLKERFTDDKETLEKVKTFETSFLESIK